MVINALKVFDIVFVMGNAEANEHRGDRRADDRWFFISATTAAARRSRSVLFVAVVPVMIWNVRQFREQETIR